MVAQVRRKPGVDGLGLGGVEGGFNTEVTEITEAEGKRKNTEPK
jgi:hypothetical protein